MTDDSLIKIATEVKACTACSLCETRRQAVPGAGYTTAPIFVLAEKPGWQEDREGIPMVGDAGKLFTSLLTRAGLRRSQCYVTNLVKCMPPREAKGRITLQQMDACRPFLDRELALIRPMVVVAMGNGAISLYYPPSLDPAMDNRVGAVHGRPRCLFTEWGNMIVMPTYNPAAALRHAPLLEVIVRDLSLVKKILDGMPRQGGESPWMTSDVTTAGTPSGSPSFMPVQAWSSAS